MSKYASGQIVIVDSRDAQTLEPNKMRPAVVVEDHELFDESWPSVILAPINESGPHVIEALSVRLEPTKDNGCTKPCYVAAHLVAATAVSRVRNTASYITGEELEAVRERIAASIGLSNP